MIRLLIESKLDSLSNEIARQIIFGVKKRMNLINSTRPQRDGRFMTRSTDFDEIVTDKRTNVDYQIKVAVRVMAATEDKTPVEASWDWATDTLEVHVNVLSQTGLIQNHHLGRLQDRLYDSIRHEIEHSIQGSDLAVSSIEAHSSWAEDPTNIIKRRNYYTDPSEVPAFVAGIYNKAKKLRQPFYKVVEEDLAKIRKAMKRETQASPSSVSRAISKIRSTWMEYAAQRFPNAIVYKQ